MVGIKLFLLPWSYPTINTDLSAHHKYKGEGCVRSVMFLFPYVQYVSNTKMLNP